MQFIKDPELKQMYQKRVEMIKADKKMFAQTQDTRFFELTGMTIDEKMFQNMINFYRNELKMVMESNDESETISKLPVKVRKTLKRNGIIMNGRGKYKITSKAHEYLKKAGS